MIAPNQNELVIKARLDLSQLQMDKRKLQSQIRDFSLGGLLDVSNFDKNSPYIKQLKTYEKDLANINHKLYQQQAIVAKVAKPFRSISDAISATKFSDLNAEIRAESSVRMVSAKKELGSATKLATYELSRLKTKITTISGAIQDSMNSRRGWVGGFERAERDIGRAVDKITGKARITGMELKKAVTLPGKGTFDSKIAGIFSSEELSAMDKNYGKAMAKQDKFLRKSEAGFVALRTRLNKLNEQPPFAGYAMSVMFAGMALQRMFTQIQKFGTKTFQEISHSVSGTVTQSDMLEGSMKYLGYTIGSALEPVVEWIIPIIDSITEWAEENPKLIATITTLGIALGTLFFVGGTGKLAYDGFVGLGVAIKDLSTAKMTGGLFGMSLSAPWIIAIIAVGGAFLALNKAIEDSPAFKSSFTTSILTPLSEAFNALFKDVDELFKAVFQSEGFWDTLGGAFLVIGRIIVYTLAPAFTILIDAMKNTIHLTKALWYAFTNQWGRSGEEFAKAFDFSASIDAAKAQYSNMRDLFGSTANGIGMKAQLAYYDNKKNVEDSTKTSSAGTATNPYTTAPYSSGGTTINVQNLYVDNSKSKGLFDNIQKQTFMLSPNSGG